MASDMAAILERVATTLSNRKLSLTAEDGVEFGRALADLANRIEQAVAILRHLIEQVNPQGRHEDLNLTPRELEMLTHLADGRTNGEIAKLCWISQNTVKFHLKNLFKKLDVRDRGQAMMIARAMHWKLEQDREGR